MLLLSSTITSFMILVLAVMVAVLATVYAEDNDNCCQVSGSCPDGYESKGTVGDNIACCKVGSTSITIDTDMPTCSDTDSSGVMETTASANVGIVGVSALAASFLALN